MKANERKNQVGDGLIRGYIEQPIATCDHCNLETMCIRIEEVILPKTVRPDNRLILFREAAPFTHPDNAKYIHINRIGIGCGCYAMAHRQMAHIADRQENRATEHA